MNVFDNAAKDRTLLSQMGFQDPDRAPDRRYWHDLAVSYCMQLEQANQLWELIYPYDDKCQSIGRTFHIEAVWTKKPGDIAPSETSPRRSFLHSCTEHPKDCGKLNRSTIGTITEHVIKRDGGYVVGFSDLLIIEKSWVPPITRNHYGNKTTYPCGCNGIIVEVKTVLDDPGSAVRQMKLYSDTLMLPPLLVVVQPAHTEAIAVVQAAGIKVVQLGQAFVDWCAKPRTNAPDLSL